ncbi:thiamine diphosphokinase [Arcanobacterium hippocoleae]|uniref:Thiamine diphosphokinase n=2 Tax=Arcanobacterium hippocoleae TaxID=149017 RepID=A0ABU1T124_9ACTO|nr:thiamine pyrophosphokinase [Arcanobacterium hippocoleae]
MNGTRLCALISGGRRDTLEGIAAADYIVAADLGYQYAREQGIVPDLIVGDFDSYPGSCDQVESLGTEILRLPREKDDSDTLAALRHCLKLGYSRFKIYCALGGRLDHLMANMQACAFLAAQGASVEVISEREYLYFLHNNAAIFAPRPGYSLSVFSLSTQSSGVSISGAAYELENETLDHTFPIGLSNEWKNENEVQISVKDGTLVVVSSFLG